MDDLFMSVRQAAQADANNHVAAAEDILDFLDRSNRTGGEASIELVSALKALTHATLAVARYTQAGTA